MFKKQKPIKKALSIDDINRLKSALSRESFFDKIKVGHVINIDGVNSVVNKIKSIKGYTDEFTCKIIVK